jgi:hypothetical protein
LAAIVVNAPFTNGPTGSFPYRPVDDGGIAEDLALDPAFVPPLRSGIEPVPVSTKGFNRGDADCFITNPAWRRDVLHPIITNLSARLPTWLLFDADWMHTRQAAPYLPLCRKIVSVGRVKWIPDSPFTGKDNCAWYLFDANSDAPAVFIGREAA